MESTSVNSDMAERGPEVDKTGCPVGRIIRINVDCIMRRTDLCRRVEEQQRGKPSLVGNLVPVIVSNLKTRGLQLSQSRRWPCRKPSKAVRGTFLSV